MVWRQIAKSPSPGTERVERSGIAESRSLPGGYIFRAKLILMLAEGTSFNAVERRLQTSAPTMIRWKHGFLRCGLDGLDTYHPGQKATVLTPALRARIVSTTRKKPSDGATHWSCRRLAGGAGRGSKDAGHRVWKEAGEDPIAWSVTWSATIRSSKAERPIFSARNVKPPRHAAVFSIDEKTAIQALDRLRSRSAAVAGTRRAPWLRVLPGQGTLSLYAALDTGTGRVHGSTACHTSGDFLAFLEEVVGVVLVAAADSYDPRRSSLLIKRKRVREFLAQHPRVQFHFTPTYSSWLNQVEIWFAKIEREVIARGIFTSVPDLARKLRRYINAYSAHARPIQWKYSDPSRRLRTNEFTATATSLPTQGRVRLPPLQFAIKVMNG